MSRRGWVPDCEPFDDTEGKLVLVAIDNGREFAFARFRHIGNGATSGGVLLKDWFYEDGARCECVTHWRHVTTSLARDLTLTPLTPEQVAARDAQYDNVIVDPPVSREDALAKVIARTSSELPWVIELDGETGFVLACVYGPHPKGALVYQRPVDATSAQRTSA